jgi:phosphoribosylanthranilate isomerase
MTRVKFCGITSLEDAQLCLDAGAWALGMIFWPGSPRHCERHEAARIGAALRRRVELAGVFVDAPLGFVARAVDELGLTLVQLHGDEGPAYCGEVGRRTGAKVVKARRVRSRGDVAGLEAFHVDFHLLDGSGGDTFAWPLVRARRTDVPLIVAGGLTPENVADAIAETQPFAVDTASGTESAPGTKDPAKVQAFAQAVEAAQVPA